MKINFLSIILLAFLIILFILKNKAICNKSYISFTFDDGYKDQYTTAFPLFKRHNITATTYIIAGLVGDSFENQTLMDWKEIKALGNGGWEIGSHTYSHRDLTELDTASINYELKQSKLILKGQGFDVKSLSVPYGKYNEHIKNIAKKYYESVRPSDWGLNKINSMEKYNLKSFWIFNSTQVNEVKSWINEADGSNGWAVIMLHHVRTNLSREYSTHPDAIEEIINYIKIKNIEVKTVSEVLDLCS